jgi:CRISPR/Cas system-associated endonuclease Cas1
MDSTAQFFVNQQVQRYEQDCQSAIAQVRRAPDMWSINRATHVSAHPVIRGFKHQLAPAKRRLDGEAEKRMEQLLDEQLKAAEAMTDIEERKTYLGRLRTRDWNALRGDFVRIWQKADREGRRLLASV